MAVKHGAHKTGRAYVVSVVEDFCKSPTAPVGYMISQVLDVSDLVCGTVNGCGSPILNMQSRVMSVIGNEAGVGGGVLSSVNRGICKPIKNAAGSVRAEGRYILRHGTEMEMNCASIDGPGNTTGVLMYITPPKDDDSCVVPPFTPTDRSLQEWMWVDMDLTDLATVLAAGMLSPFAILLRGLAELPLIGEYVDAFLQSLPDSSSGTGDKSGIGGPIIGDSTGEGTPGIVGIAFSLAHKLSELLGGDGGVKYEKGQGDCGHNGKTAVGYDSVWYLSLAETIGQFLGIIFRKLGELIGLPIGDLFFRLCELIFGEAGGYGFMSGVWKGSHQNVMPI